jgi:hypothetical protein
MSAGVRAALLIAAAALGGGLTHTARAEDCDSRLSVELTPDVPDSRSAGFLSSLLSNEVGYQLIFRGRSDDSNIVVELVGPGQAYSCRQAIQTMSRDARVISIHVLKAGVV